MNLKCVAFCTKKCMKKHAEHVSCSDSSLLCKHVLAGLIMIIWNYTAVKARGKSHITVWISHMVQPATSQLTTWSRPCLPLTRPCPGFPGTLTRSLLSLVICLTWYRPILRLTAHQTISLWTTELPSAPDQPGSLQPGNLISLPPPTMLFRDQGFQANHASMLLVASVTEGVSSSVRSCTWVLVRVMMGKEFFFFLTSSNAWIQKRV